MIPSGLRATKSEEDDGPLDDLSVPADEVAYRKDYVERTSDTLFIHKHH